MNEKYFKTIYKSQFYKKKKKKKKNIFGWVIVHY